MTAALCNWPQHAAYLQSSLNCRTMNIVNDCAKRGMKLSADEAKNLIRILQVVEEDHTCTYNFQRMRSHTSL